MRYVARDEIAGRADIHEVPRQGLTRAEKLERWADVLMQKPDRILRSLGEIEWVAKAERPRLRSDNSPLTVAFADPVLRGEGLGSDTYGDAVRFFELSERDAHRLLCSCMNGWSMRADLVAGRVRRMTTVSPVRAFFARLGF